MKILLLGKYGQLGWELRRALAPAGGVTALDYPEIDLVNLSLVREAVRTHQPEVIVNATAYTAVDRAESEPELALAINARAPALLAEEALRLGVPLIHYSTDYVFDGSKGNPYLESDPPNPVGVYGQSKLEGERLIQAVGGDTLILRTSWVYSLRRDSFVTKVLQWSRQQLKLHLVCDQVSNPTWARMLAEVTALLLVKGGDGWLEWLSERRGLYHLAGSGYASRLQWAQVILKLDPKPAEQLAREIQPVLTADFPTPAQRPLFSALNCDLFGSTFGLHLPPWEETLRLAMENNLG
jgi:dTDP-4-dehydrorhamnose reductase